VVNHLSSRHPELKPLLLLNVGRTKSPQARTPAAQALMSELRESKSFYITPAGSNDDWCGGSGALHALRQHLPRWRCPRAWWEKLRLPLSPPVLPLPAAVPAGTGFTPR
jgi:hypothetical protein